MVTMKKELKNSKTENYIMSKVKKKHALDGQKTGYYKIYYQLSGR